MTIPTNFHSVWIYLWAVMEEIISKSLSLRLVNQGLIIFLEWSGLFLSISFTFEWELDELNQKAWALLSMSNGSVIVILQSVNIDQGWRRSSSAQLRLAQISSGYIFTIFKTKLAQLSHFIFNCDCFKFSFYIQFI